MSRTKPASDPLVTQLRSVLPESCIVADPVSMKPYECDGLSAYRQMPRVVVLPESVEQVQAVLKICQQTGTPVVPRGAGTSLSGGAMPHKNGVVLSLARLNSILQVDEDNRTARVQAGVRNLQISEAVQHLGLYYAPDPSSQIACTIGGNVAENAGGVHCLKYGLTVHNILQVKMVNLDGELISIGSTALDSPGYDLLALLMGSEGMLGIVVEVLVRLLPRPKVARVLMAAYDDIEKAGNAVASVIAAGVIPGGFEMMDKAAIQASEEFVRAGYPTDAAAILLCELDGSEDDVIAQVEKVEKLLASSGAVDIRLASDEQQRVRFWSGRKNAFPAMGRISPDYYCMDGTIPRKELGNVLTRISHMSEKYDLRVANVFHAGDGNLHPLILYDANQPDEFEKAEAFGAEILDLCVAVGGTITGEHGVGVEKIDRMCVQFDEFSLSQFLAVRKAFDPDGLLNPDKAVPTLARCAEFNAMHVHHGQLAHPELERF
ncbi:MAG: FAD-linked oxidase C-terminal domain-containing protein [Xanthomonadales bacterium]|nr:FAD-linked oxidase C-terminal domain-containing protein [Xanthomonadales bacterium]